MILGVIYICLVMIRKTTFNYFNHMIFNIKAFMCEVRVDHTHLLFSDYPRNKVPFNNYLRLVITIRSNSVTLSTNLYKYHVLFCSINMYLLYSNTTLYCSANRKVLCPRSVYISIQHDKTRHDSCCII